MGKLADLAVTQVLHLKQFTTSTGKYVIKHFKCKLNTMGYTMGFKQVFREGIAFGP